MIALTEVRKAQGLSISELARKAEMHVSSICQIESGYLVPYPRQKSKIARALGWQDEERDVFGVVERVASPCCEEELRG